MSELNGEIDLVPVKAGREGLQHVGMQRTANGGMLPMPTSFAEMIDMAAMMSKSGVMVGKGFRGNPGACLGILTQAMRWGLEPFAASQKAYVTTQKDGSEAIAYEAQLVSAVINNSPTIEGRLRPTYEGEGDELRVTIVGRIKGEADPLEYRSPPVKSIKGRSPLWTQDPEQQLYYYACRSWVRRWVPEILMGVYDEDEVAEIGMKNITPAPTIGGKPMTLSSLNQPKPEPPSAEPEPETVEPAPGKAKPEPDPQEPANSDAPEEASASEPAATGKSTVADAEATDTAPELDLAAPSEPIAISVPKTKAAAEKTAKVIIEHMEGLPPEQAPMFLIDNAEALEAIDSLAPAARADIDKAIEGMKGS